MDHARPVACGECSTHAQLEIGVWTCETWSCRVLGCAPGFDQVVNMLEARPTVRAFRDGLEMPAPLRRLVGAIRKTRLV